MSKGLNHETYGPPVLEALAPEFPTDYSSAIDALAGAADEQGIAKGAVHVRTTAQLAHVADVDLLSTSARQAAKASFVGQEALLHDAFLIGKRNGQGLRDKVRDGYQLVAACKEHAEALAPNGWPATHTTLLETAVKALDVATIEQDAAFDAKLGRTAGQVKLINMLYRMSRAIQCVAKVVYPLKNAANDPTVIEARALFLLDEFPRRYGARATPSSPGDPAGTTPPPAAGGGAAAPGTSAAPSGG